MNIIRLMLLYSIGTLGWGAVIEGVVLEKRTGKPLARARITIETIKDGTTAPPAYSDSKGGFRIANLAAGTYRISAERSGFVIGRFGQSSYDSAGSPISLTSDGHFFVEVRLQRPGSISGLVADENGVGISGFPVLAYRIGTRPKLVASVTTDDRGMYRLPTLGPAKYAVITVARALDDGKRLLPTFYGGATRLEEAKLVEVTLDGEITGVNIEPQAGQLNVVRGKINAAGILAVQMLGSLGMHESALRADGSFEFSNVAAGTYTVLAGAQGEHSISGAETFSVAGDDRFINLKLGPSPVVRLRCADAAGKDAPIGLVVFLDRDILSDTEERRLDCGKSLTVPAGRWRLRPLPLFNAFLESLSGTQVSTQQGTEYEMVAAPGDTTEIVATIGSGPALITGRVHWGGGDPAAGVPVGMIAVDDHVRRLMGGARLTRTDPNGAYRFDGLAPGDYRLFASFALDSAVAVENFGPGGETVRVERGGHKEAELRWEQ